MIRIRTLSHPKDKHGCLPRWATKVTTADGEPVQGVTEMTIHIHPDDIIHADLTILVAAVDVEAHPLLSFETVTDAAAHYGYRLTPIEGDAA